MLKCKFEQRVAKFPHLKSIVSLVIRNGPSQVITSHGQQHMALGGIGRVGVSCQYVTPTPTPIHPCLRGPSLHHAQQQPRNPPLPSITLFVPSYNLRRTQQQQQQHPSSVQLEGEAMAVFLRATWGRGYGGVLQVQERGGYLLRARAGAFRLRRGAQAPHHGHRAPRPWTFAWPGPQGERHAVQRQHRRGVRGRGRADPGPDQLELTTTLPGGQCRI